MVYIACYIVCYIRYSIICDVVYDIVYEFCTYTQHHSMYSIWSCPAKPCINQALSMLSTRVFLGTRKSTEEDAVSNPVHFMSMAKLTAALDDAVYFQDNYAPDQFAQVADWLTLEIDSLRSSGSGSSWARQTPSAFRSNAWRRELKPPFFITCNRGQWMRIVQGAKNG